MKPPGSRTPGKGTDMIYNKQTGTYRRGFLTSFKVRDVWMSVGIIFIITGMMLAIGSGVSATGLDKFDETATAVIIDYVKSEKTLVEYQVDGQKYTAWLSFYRSGDTIGDEITIRYNSADPRDSEYGGEALVYILYGAAGMMGILGLVLVIWRVRRRRRNRALLENGQFVWATVIQIKLDTSINNNGSHPWVVLCEYINGEQYYEFTSERTNIRPHLTEGESVKVYVAYKDNQIISDYYVCLDDND